MYSAFLKLIQENVMSYVQKSRRLTFGMAVKDVTWNGGIPMKWLGSGPLPFTIQALGYCASWKARVIAQIVGVLLPC